MNSRRSIAIRQTVTIGVALFGAVCIVAHCSGCWLTPKQAGDSTQAACTLVQAFAGSEVVDSICASAPELAALAAAAMAARADSGARYAMRCRIIPDTTTCATDAEIQAGIRAVRAAR